MFNYIPNTITYERRNMYGYGEEERGDDKQIFLLKILIDLKH